MSPEVISATAQRFNGTTYYYCGKYFQRDGVRLHRAVWEFTNGTIADGMAVHHIDEDRSNNRLDNLCLMVRGEHTSMHQSGHARPLSEPALSAAAKWHGSEEGIAWHKKHYELHGSGLHATAEFTCEQCNKAFVAVTTGTNRFCTNACKSAWRRKSGLDDVEADCPVCAAKFKRSKYSKKETCSRKCGGVISMRRRNASRKV